MKMRLLTLANPEFQRALQNLGGDSTFPAKDRLKLARWMISVRRETQLLEESRQALIRKYLEVGAKRTGQKAPTVGTVAPEELSAFTAEFQQLLEEEVEIDDVEKLKLPETSKLTAGELTQLGIIIDLEDTPQQANPPKVKR